MITLVRFVARETSNISGYRFASILLYLNGVRENRYERVLSREGDREGDREVRSVANVHLESFPRVKRGGKPTRIKKADIVRRDPPVHEFGRYNFDKSRRFKEPSFSVDTRMERLTEGFSKRACKYSHKWISPDEIKGGRDTRSSR